MANNLPVVQAGSKGEDVRTVQYLVTHHGHPAAADGVFGAQTEAAVKAFQTDRSLTVDGIVGSQTWTALLAAVSPGASGPTARAVQGQLRSQGWRVAVDGAFGPKTAAAVRDFQTAHHLGASGVVDAATWKVLIADFTRLASPHDAAGHLYDAWGARDRPAALTGATQAAVDLLLRGERGDLNDAGCGPHPQLGEGFFVCSYTYEGGAVNLWVEGNDVDGYYVESASFFAD